MYIKIIYLIIINLKFEKNINNYNKLIYIIKK